MSENAALGYEIMQLRSTLVDLFSEMRQVRIKKGRGEIINREGPDMKGFISIEYVNNIPTQVKFIQDGIILSLGGQDSITDPIECLFPFNQIAGIRWDKIEKRRNE